MSEINGRYKQIITDLEDNIKDPEVLDFVKDKFAELSMLFIDMIDRVTKLTDNKIQEIETKQQEISTKINSIQSVVDEMESDIYEEDDDEDETYEFEIVCPYCNYEFTADIEDESKDEIQCPECHNTIELDWNLDDEQEGCSGSCSHCSANCVAEDEEEYNIEESKPENDDKQDKPKDDQDEDM